MNIFLLWGKELRFFFYLKEFNFWILLFYNDVY